MQVIRGRAEGAVSAVKGDTFTGTVWGDSVLPTTEVDHNTINSVTFTPGSRTHWHEHSRGQILIVTAGEGFVCPAGENAARIRAGDVVWVPPGERHWHGATATTVMTHLAISIGATSWSDEVGDDEFVASTKETQ